MFRPLVTVSLFISVAASLSAAKTTTTTTSTTTTTTTAPAPLVLPPTRVIISVKDQKMLVLQNETKVAVYPVSTSKYGMGDFWGRMTTPLGYLQVAQKIGDNAPLGAVFHNRRFTGEVIPANAPGRDPITTRILWLRGLELQNAHAFSRCIYIHGTPEEKNLGHPASYGCIRMRAKDVAALYNQLPLGALVQIVPDRLPHRIKETPSTEAFVPASASSPILKNTTRVASNGGHGA